MVKKFEEEIGFKRNEIGIELPQWCVYCRCLDFDCEDKDNHHTFGLFNNFGVETIFSENDVYDEDDIKYFCRKCVKNSVLCTNNMLHSKNYVSIEHLIDKHTESDSYVCKHIFAIADDICQYECIICKLKRFGHSWDKKDVCLICFIEKKTVINNCVHDYYKGVCVKNCGSEVN